MGHLIKYSAGPAIENLPGQSEGTSFMSRARSPAGVGDRGGRLTVGVVDGDMKTTFSFMSTVIAVVVVIVVVAFVVS